MVFSLFEEKVEFMKVSEKNIFRFVSDKFFDRKVHWFKTVDGGRRSINCAGDGCPFCKVGNPAITKYLVLVYNQISNEINVLEISKQVLMLLRDIIKNNGPEAFKKDFILLKKKNSNPYYSLMVASKTIDNDDAIKEAVDRWFSKFKLDDIEKLTKPTPLDTAVNVFLKYFDKSILEECNEEVLKELKNIVSKGNNTTTNKRNASIEDDIFNEDDTHNIKQKQKEVKVEDDFDEDEDEKPKKKEIGKNKGGLDEKYGKENRGEKQEKSKLFVDNDEDEDEDIEKILKEKNKKSKVNNDEDEYEKYSWLD